MATRPTKNSNGPSPNKSLWQHGVERSLFTDHRGRGAISVYAGSRPREGASVLPPQWCFQCFVTFGPTADSAGSLPEDILEAVTRTWIESSPVRLDVYFYPGADAPQCMNIYREEKAARQSVDPGHWFIDPYRSEYGHFSLLLQIDSLEWSTTGATLAYFDMHSDLEDKEQQRQDHIRRNVSWSGDSGVVPTYVGQYLHGLKSTNEVDELSTIYEERIAQGRSDWG